MDTTIFRSAFAALVLPAALIATKDARASLYGTGGTETLLDNGTVAVHTFTNNGTFTLSEDKVVRILVVGGGGGGGAECGGGGGGGGVVENSAYRLAAGTYTIAIGAGGLGGAADTSRGNGTERGGNGGDTIVSNGAEELFRAYGGGGGGGWASAYRNGVNGGCGGGAAATGDGGSAIDPSQGYGAGRAAGGGTSLPTGGGGAGAASANVTAARGAGLSGTGGAGRVSDISGTAQMYGAGGGGGNYSYSNADAQASGGDGIGGFGMGNTNVLKGNEKGRDGYGGGGGGGSNVSPYVAADGGCGTVIIRLSNVASSETPVFSVVSTTPGSDSVVFGVAVLDVGSGSSDGTVDVVAQLASSADAWDSDFSGTEQLIASGIEIGDHSLRAMWLNPQRTYYARLIVSNDVGATSSSVIFSFSTTIFEEERWTMEGRSGENGLWQYRFTDSGGNDIYTEFDETTDGITVQVGTIAAGLASKNGNPIHGLSYTDASGMKWSAGAFISYAYIGYMWMEAGVTYNFFEHHYDGARLEIDGTDVISNIIYGDTSTGQFVCNERGWHRIRVWLTSPSGDNLGVPPGWTFSFGWNTNGVTSVSDHPGSDWIPLENTDDDIFLRTEPLGRDVDISSWTVNGTAATFNAQLGEGTRATDLYAVWGPYHGGDTTNEWAHVALLENAVGLSETNFSYTVSDISGLRYFRFVAIDSMGLNAWSQGQLVDLANPVVSVAGVTHDGDLATVSVRVDSVGSGDFSLRLLWGGNADLSGASVTNVATSGVGSYEVVIPVVPGATTWYRVEAETTEGGSDATQIESFTTLAGSVLSATKSAEVNNYDVTFKGSLAALGAGTNTAVTLWTGESADALVADPNPIVVSAVGQFSFQRLISGAPHDVYWKFTCSNTAPGGSSWNNSTTVGVVATTEEGIEYTWKSGVSQGEWKDANNWTSSAENSFGYPAYVEALAKFPDGVNARVHLSGYVESRLKLQYVNGHVTLVGDDPDTSYLYTGDTVESATLPGSTFTVENATVAEYDNFDYSLGGTSTENSRIIVTNGARICFGGGYMAVLGSGSGFTVGPGSSVWYGDDSVAQTNKTGKIVSKWRLLFAASGESLTIDDGIFSVRNLYVAGADSEAGQSFRIRGPGGQLRVTGGIFGDFAKDTSHKWTYFQKDHPLTNDVDVVFEPVGGAFTNNISYVANDEQVAEAVPLVSVSDVERAFGEMELPESNAKIRLSMDRKSVGSRVRQHLVLWKGGIDTNHVELVQGEGYELSYTYGWPSTLSAPATEGDTPTGVWAECAGTTGLILLLR